MPSRKKQWSGAPVFVDPAILRAALTEARAQGLSDRRIAERMARSYFGSSWTKGDVHSIGNQISALANGKQRRCGLDFRHQLAKALGYPDDVLSDDDGKFRRQLPGHWSLADTEDELAAPLPSKVQLALFRFWRDVAPAIQRDFAPSEQRWVREILEGLLDPAHWRVGLHKWEGFSPQTLSPKGEVRKWRPTDREEAAWLGLIVSMLQILQPWIRGFGALNIRALWLLYRSLQAPETLPRRHVYAPTEEQRRQGRVRRARVDGYTVVQSEEERVTARRKGVGKIMLVPPLRPKTGRFRSIEWKEWRDLE